MWVSKFFGYLKTFKFPIWGVFVVFCSLYIGFLTYKNTNLKLENAKLKTQIYATKYQLDMQNAKVKELELASKSIPKPTTEEKRVEKVYLKDKGCEAELKAYKALFEGEK